MVLHKTAFLVATAVALPLAQAVGLTSSELSPLLNLGAVGAVLLWFMLRSEPRLVRIEEALNRQSRMMGLTIMSMENVSESVKRQAKGIITEIDEIEASRKKTT